MQSLENPGSWVFVHYLAQLPPNLCQPSPWDLAVSIVSLLHGFLPGKANAK